MLTFNILDETPKTSNTKTSNTKKLPSTPKKPLTKQKRKQKKRKRNIEDENEFIPLLKKRKKKGGSGETVLTKSLFEKIVRNPGLVDLITTKNLRFGKDTLALFFKLHEEDFMKVILKCEYFNPPGRKILRAPELLKRFIVLQNNK